MIAFHLSSNRRQESNIADAGRPNGKIFWGNTVLL